MAPQFFQAKMTLFVAEDLPEALPGDEPEPLEKVPWNINEVEKRWRNRILAKRAALTALLLMLRNKGR